MYFFAFFSKLCKWFGWELKVFLSRWDNAIFNVSISGRVRYWMKKRVVNLITSVASIYEHIGFFSLRSSCHILFLPVFTTLRFIFGRAYIGRPDQDKLFENACKNRKCKRVFNDGNILAVHIQIGISFATLLKMLQNEIVKYWYGWKIFITNVSF